MMARRGPDLRPISSPTGEPSQAITVPDGTRILMPDTGMGRSLRRLAHEIIERSGQIESLALVGIRTRGGPLALRLAAQIESIEGLRPRVGHLDITMYRDDLAIRSGMSEILPSEIDFPLDGLDVILVDDVIFTGRSARAALDALVSYGRPARVQLAVLVDRGHRELPIRPDYVGKNVPTGRHDHVRVLLAETDGQDRVIVQPDAQ